MFSTIRRTSPGACALPSRSGSACGGYRSLHAERQWKPADETYFTFDTTNGSQDLLAELPPGNASVKPVGINDSGQILAALTLPSGAIHWGMLAPPVAQNVRALQRTARARSH